MQRFARVVLLAAALSALFAAGVFVGGHPANLPRFVQDALIDRTVALDAQIVDRVEHDYFKKVDRKKLENESATAIVKGLGDRFSAYLDPLHTRLFRETETGEYTGVGLTVAETERGLRVARVIDGSPASRGGIRKGDLIVAVDGVAVGENAARSATMRIRGREGTTVTLKLVDPRTGKERTVTAKRSKIAVPLTTGRIVAPASVKIGIVALTGFDRGAGKQLKGEITRARGEGAKGVVLDLRGNPGGLIDEAVNVAGLFLEDKTIVTTQGRRRPNEVYKSGGHAAFPSMPLVVLVDRASASASEIVSGALQDYGRAKIVGTRTFGKGVFQEVFPLANGGSLDLTVGHYYTPHGRDLGGKGVDPDIPVSKRGKKAIDVARDEALMTIAHVGEPSW